METPIIIFVIMGLQLLATGLIFLRMILIGQKFEADLERDRVRYHLRFLTLEDQIQDIIQISSTSTNDQLIKDLEKVLDINAVFLDELEKMKMDIRLIKEI